MFPNVTFFVEYFNFVLGLNKARELKKIYDLDWMQIYLLLTERCNLNCKMCIRGDKSNKELSLIDIKELQTLEELTAHDIVITGGEPTLCKEFIPIVDFLKDKCKSVSICTNGTTDYYINKNFLDSKISIQFSLDGIREIHDSIRGHNSYDRIMSTILKLEALEIPYTISTVVNKNNAFCMKSLADVLSDLKNLKRWNLSYEMPFGDADITEILSTEEWNSFVDSMLEYVHFRMKIQKMFPFELFEKYKDKLDDLFKGHKCSNCGSGRNKIYIYPDLNVYPCTCLTDFCLGNLKDSSLTEILNSELATKFANYSVTPESTCFSCEYLKYCNGGCIGMSYHYFHNIGYGDPRCPKLRTCL